MTRSIIADTPVGETLWFSSLTGREALSELFEYRVKLKSESFSVSPDSLLGLPFTVAADALGGAKRHLSGHCTRFAFSGKSGRYYEYEAIVRPTLWYASRGVDNKVFQHKRVPDIIKEVLGKYPVLIADRLSGNYRVFDYCVQYRETDLNFVNRLMEHEGIYYFFEHSAGSSTLVLADSLGSHKPFAGYESVPFYAPDVTYADDSRDHFGQWHLTQAVDSGTFATTEYDFKKPRADLKEQRAHPRPHGNAGYEVYDFPGGYTESGDGENYARLRMEALQSGHERVTGTGAVRGAAPGCLLGLENHRRGDQNRQYLVTGIELSLQDNQYESDGSGEYRFDCVMQAMPTTETWRPKRVTPKPRTTGPESALVVGPPGEEIHTDPYGRVKVQFHWDRIGGKDQDSSCWVRVSHPWAGSGFGAIHTPRIGQEVLVDFIGGDPDRPIVTHRLYNADNMPPWALPANATQSGIFTRSTKGGQAGAGVKDGPGTANALRFEDKRGEEQLWLHAEKDQLTEVEHDEDKWVGNDRRKTIDRDETSRIRRDRTETVDRNEKIDIHGWRTEVVDGNETITVHSHRKERVDRSERIDIGDNRDETVGRNETTRIGHNKTDTVGSHWDLKTGTFKTERVGIANTETIGAARMSTIGVTYSVNVGAVMNTLVGMSQSTQVGKTKSLDVGDNYSADIGKTYTLKVGTTAATQVGEHLSSSAGKVQVHTAGEHFELRCGEARIVLTRDGGIYLTGTHIEINGATAVHADGAMSEINTGSAQKPPDAPAAPEGDGGSAGGGAGGPSPVMDM